jgi:CIC family chloride channel protein
MNADDDKRSPRPPQPHVGIRLEHRLSHLLGGQTVFLLVLAAVLGVAGGYGAILFRYLIEAVNHIAFPGGVGLDQLRAGPWFKVVLPPAVGGLIVGPLVYFAAREARGHGVPEVMDACINRGGQIRPRVALVKIMASAFCIGTGGSVGREGPIVQIGAAVGSSLGQIFGLAGERLKTMVAAGAAAGLAATFNAPIAGVLFATEIILGRGSARTFSPLIVSSVIATVVARHHLGNYPAFRVAPYDLVSPWELLLYVLLGAVCACVGVAFIKGLYALEDLWEKLPLPEYTWGVAGGAMIGAIALWLPQVLGVGYEHIEEILAWRSPHLPLGTAAGAGLLLVVVAVKIFATGTTIGSGGSGGIFAPSLFMGASVGGAFGTLVGRLMPSGTVARPPAYATVAMGAVVSAATHAPLQAILIVFELTDRHTIILPLMLSCILSAVMAMRLSRESIYTLKLIRRGSRVGAGRESEIMSETQVRDLARPVEETLHPDTRLDEVVDRVVEHRHPEIYVIDDTGQLHGLVDIEDVATILRDAEDLQAVLVAADVMRPCIGSVHPEDTLDRCLILFSQRQVKRLPVVNDQGLLIGRISRADVIGHYNREILRRDAVLRFDDTVEEPAKSGERVHLAHGDIKAEIPVAGSLVGRTLRDLDLRARFEVSVYAVRDQEGESRFPDPGRPLLHGETLEVHGPAGGINQVRRLASE